MFQGFRERVLGDIAEFCARHDVSERHFGLHFAGDHKFIARLRNGSNVGVARLEEIEAKATAWVNQGDAMLAAIVAENADAWPGLWSRPADEQEAA